MPATPTGQTRPPVGPVRHARHTDQSIMTDDDLTSISRSLARLASLTSSLCCCAVCLLSSSTLSVTSSSTLRLALSWLAGQSEPSLLRWDSPDSLSSLSSGLTTRHHPSLIDQLCAPHDTNTADLHWPSHITASSTDNITAVWSQDSVKSTHRINS